MTWSAELYARLRFAALKFTAFVRTAADREIRNKYPFQTDKKKLMRKME